MRKTAKNRTTGTETEIESISDEMTTETETESEIESISDETQHNPDETPKISDEAQNVSDEAPTVPLVADTTRFSKEQFLKSKTFINERGILRSQLKDDQKYTKGEVRDIINDFRNINL